MTLDLNVETAPIDPTDPRYAQLLGNLQGNILKSHGRNSTINLFLTFQAGEQEAVKTWLGHFTRRYVTSALRQMQESLEFKLNGLSGRIFATLSLSAAGYEYLGVDLDTFPEARLPHPLLTTDIFFKTGMKAAQTSLSDPDPATWQFNRPGQDVHAVILLADEDRKRLDDVVTLIDQDLARRQILDPAVPLVRLDGIALRDEFNQPLEHFGYRDGVSQPLFFAQDVAEEAAKFGASEWDPSAPLSLALIPDPLTDRPDSFGSYLVFRKLKQNVARFVEAEEALAKTLNLPGKAEERAGALVVGRFENGIPLEVAGSFQAEKYRDFNNFNYHDDPIGARCPFQGHIRKTNPRGDTARVLLPQLPPNLTAVLGMPPLSVLPVEVIDAVERMRRITRRGITFGLRYTIKRDDCGMVITGHDGKPTLFTDGDGELVRPELANGHLDPPLLTDDIGLLFQCYQSSIPNQFGFMQKSWANNTDFAKSAVGLDPIIGQKSDGKIVGQEAMTLDGQNNVITDAAGNIQTHPIEHQWPTQYDDPASPKVAFDFGAFVTLDGGEFFFTPSIPYLLQFGTQEEAVSSDIKENERRGVPLPQASS